MTDDGIDFGTVIVRGPLTYCRYEPKLGLGRSHMPRRFPRRRQYWLSDDWWKPWTWEWFVSGEGRYAHNTGTKADAAS